jgi:hypothetical protein
LVLVLLIPAPARAGASEGLLPTAGDLPAEATTHRGQPDASGTWTWWLPGGADELVLPITAGVDIPTSRADLMAWLRAGSPWGLTDLPVIGARYGDQFVVVIVPEPLYAEMVVTDRIGVKFSFPRDRRPAHGCTIVTVKRPWSLLAAADAFRQWRAQAKDTGDIPAPRTLARKIRQNPRVRRLLGAPHFYLWGPGLFSKHDVRKGRWKEFARSLHDAPADTFAGRLVRSFGTDDRDALGELVKADWPANYRVVSVAGAINRSLGRRRLLQLPPATPIDEVIDRNCKALAGAFPGLLNDPDTWGDGPSVAMVNALHDAGVNRALLLLSDLYAESTRPNAAKRAEELGYLFGPYDAYHSVHSPDAPPDETWETSQFDRAAYDNGRVLNADGSGHPGFKGRGFHFAPQAAWPYLRGRVNSITQRVPYSAYFIDCDATAECFDDYSPQHPATRNDDVRLRRQRLGWLDESHHLVVGSEGGSVLFADVIAFGHGIQTPYLGHLDPAFKDQDSPHFLGKYWPPDQPAVSFKPTTVPPALRVPYFDPTVRIPLYRAALGDELIATHHWSFDSMKFSDVQQTRELLDVLYMTPPMYHLNRQAWPQRRERIRAFTAFWSPLHQELGAAPMTAFEFLSDDRLLQRATYETPHGHATITVNFARRPSGGHPALSATADGDIRQANRVYVATSWEGEAPSEPIPGSPKGNPPTRTPASPPKRGCPDRHPSIHSQLAGDASLR